MKIPTAKEVSCTQENSSRSESGNSGASPDFSEYMWMENEEEFDEQVIKQLEEEALMEQCIEAMLEEEYENQQKLERSLESLGLEDRSDLAKKSTLNPDAAEFIPQSVPKESIAAH